MSEQFIYKQLIELCTTPVWRARLLPGSLGAAGTSRLQHTSLPSPRARPCWGSPWHLRNPSRIHFQPPGSTWHSRSCTGPSPWGSPKSLGLEQGQQSQVSALPYKRCRSSWRDSGSWGLIALKNDRWAPRSSIGSRFEEQYFQLNSQ